MTQREPSPGADAFERLWPPPREVARGAGPPIHPSAPPVVAAGPGGLHELWSRARGLFGPTRFARPAAEGTPLFARIDPGMPREDYALALSGDRVTAESGSERGLFRALTTLAQLLHVAAAGTGDEADGPLAIPAARVEDGPSFPRRGFHLDVSRGRVPTMESLRALVDRMARWKLDQLQLYVEHTFAYSAHRKVWRGASPLTHDEVRELEAYAAERFVELVPNQQSFGHMHRWLRHAPYRALAECPEGVEHPFSREREPFSLCPTDPAALELLAGLYDELLPCFRSTLFNVGLDETFDLGRGRSAEACRTRGAGAVYLDFLRSVHALAAERGRRPQFWADVALKHPEVLDGAPSDAIPLVWGYEADHAFEEPCRAAGERGLEFYVCPGTSSWQSFGGRFANARANLWNAARAGEREGAVGYLVTDWGDRGHHQPPSISRFGLWFGAGCAWSGAGAVDPDDPALARRLSLHAFDDPGGATGRALAALGDAGRQCDDGATNGTGLFFLLVFCDEPLPHPRFPGLGREGLERAAALLEATGREVERARPDGADGSVVRDELQWTRDVLAFACRFGRARLAAGEGAGLGAIDAATRRALADELRDLVERHRAGWLATSRPGGLEESCAWLERVAERLLGGR